MYPYAAASTNPMKVPIDDYACIDLDAPVLPAYEAFVSGSEGEAGPVGKGKADPAVGLAAG
jgi:hypothetical protein